MNTRPIWIIGLLLAFILLACVSISSLEEGRASLSVITMLEAIWLLFLAYEDLRDSLEERLKVD